MLSKIFPWLKKTDTIPTNYSYDVIRTGDVFYVIDTNGIFVRGPYDRAQDAKGQLTRLKAA